jgi:hypothetical protein
MWKKVSPCYSWNIVESGVKHQQKSIFMKKNIYDFDITMYPILIVEGKTINARSFDLFVYNTGLTAYETLPTWQQVHQNYQMWFIMCKKTNVQ